MTLSVSLFKLVGQPDVERVVYNELGLILKTCRAVLDDFVLSCGYLRATRQSFKRSLIRMWRMLRNRSAPSFRVVVRVRGPGSHVVQLLRFS